MDERDRKEIDDIKKRLDGIEIMLTTLINKDDDDDFYECPYCGKMVSDKEHTLICEVAD